METKESADAVKATSVERGAAIEEITRAEAVRLSVCAVASTIATHLSAILP